MKKCSVKDCNRVLKNRTYYCEAHYYRIRRTGSSGAIPIIKKEFHGQHTSPEYKALISAKARCNNKNLWSYKYYGGRGIKVCSRWDSFNNFIKDMGKKPSKYHSLDRINNDGDYSPSNCRWATIQQQVDNKRRTIFVRYRGESITLRDLSNRTGISKRTLSTRYYYGWRGKKLYRPLLRQR